MKVVDPYWRCRAALGRRDEVKLRSVIWGGRFQIFHFLYGGKYAAFTPLALLLLGLLPLAQSVPNILGNALVSLSGPCAVMNASLARLMTTGKGRLGSD